MENPPKLLLGSFLLHLSGGILGIIGGIMLLRLLSATEMIKQGNYNFIDFWLNREPSHAALLITALTVMGILSANWKLTKDRLKIERASIKSLSEINRSKTEAVSLVAHELRTPVASINWAIKSLLEEDYGQISDAQKNILSELFKKNRDVGNLIIDFLDSSKIDIEKLEIFLKTTGLEELTKELKKVAEEFKILAREKDILVEFNPNFDSRFSVSVDLKRINQIIENLLKNALNYTPEGGKINFSLENDKHKIKIKISDSGIGIPAQEQNKIFDKFFRATNARKLQSTGTGLGLYLCKKLIEGHGGKIWFESPIDKKKGCGTTFIISIPLRLNGEVEELFRKI